MSAAKHDQGSFKTSSPIRRKLLDDVEFRHRNKVGEDVPLIKSVAGQIRQYKLLEQGETVVVGVSGGPDSVALLYILCQLSTRLGIKPVVAHLNHGFRGVEAQADASFVTDLAHSLDIPAFVEARDVDTYCAKNHLSHQQGAREVRYNFLREVATRTGATKVALGHHADDQAETVLLHLIRGAGINGLKGMLPMRDGFYIRPLLAFRRQEIEDFCLYHHLVFCTDSSNLKTEYLRNQIRLELIPLLKRKYNPNVVETLNRLGALCWDEDHYLEQQALKVYTKVCLADNRQNVSLSVKGLREAPTALIRRVIRLAWSSVHGGQQDLSYRHIEQVTAVLNSGGGYRQIDLPNNIKCIRNYDTLHFAYVGEPHSNELNGSFNKEILFYQYLLKIPGSTFIPELDVSINAELLSRGMWSDFDPLQGYLDYDLLRAPLIVRRKLAGDKFAPLGLDGVMKLKKFFIEQKIPRSQREHIPLIVCGSDIVWVAGWRVGEKWKVTEHTVNCLRLQIVDHNE